jgi:hypothetical protein
MDTFQLPVVVEVREAMVSVPFHFGFVLELSGWMMVVVRSVELRLL